jgi:hypothetical protein
MPASTVIDSGGSAIEAEDEWKACPMGCDLVDEIAL